MLLCNHQTLAAILSLLRLKLWTDTVKKISDKVNYLPQKFTFSKD